MMKFIMDRQYRNDGNCINKDENKNKTQEPEDKNKTKNKNKKQELPPKVMDSMENGRLFFRQRKYDEAINEFKTSLQLRDGLIGQYDKFTATIYFFLGNCYYEKKDYDNAIVAYRTRIRIRRWLTSDDSTKTTDINKKLITCLKKKGYKSKQIQAYDENLNKSIMIEKTGDTYRATGNYSNAIYKYKEAIAIEKKSVDGIKVTVAFLWRKVASLHGKIDSQQLIGKEVNSIRDEDDNTAYLRKLYRRTKGTRSTPDSLASITRSLLPLRRASSSAIKEEEEVNIFQAMYNLADENEHDNDNGIQLQSLVECIDETMDHLHKLEKSTRRISKPEMERPVQNEESDQQYRRSFSESQLGKSGETNLFTSSKTNINRWS